MELKDLSNTALVGVFNTVTGKNLKKFTDKAEAVRRTEAALAGAGKTLVFTGDHPSVVDAQPNVKAVVKGARGRKKALTRDMTITVVTPNPCKVERVRKLYALFSSGTVGAFLDAAVAAGYSEQDAYGALSFRVKNGDLKVS